jgi:hypothetical protein
MSIIGRPAKTTAGTIAASRTSASDKEKEAAFRAAFFRFQGSASPDSVADQSRPPRRASRGLGVTMHSCVRYAASFVAFGIG